jgi:ankyrin repeat protein
MYYFQMNEENKTFEDAYKSWDYELTKHMLERGHNPDVFKCRYSPLLYAIIYDKRNFIELFLKFGANPDYVCCNNHTPRQTAYLANNKYAIDLFVKYEKNTNKNNLNV